MPREILAGHAALVAVQLCFGLFPVFGKFAFEPGGFSPFAVAFWRMTVGALVLSLIALCVHGKRFWPGARELPGLFVLALIGVVANQGLYLSGLARSSAVEAGLVMCLIPVFTFGVALLARQERFSTTRGLGLVVALGGALFWVLGERSDLVQAHGLGNALMALNALFYAFYLVYSKPFLTRNPPLVVIAWVFLFAALCSPAFAWGQDLLPAESSSRARTALLYILVFPTVLGYLLNLFAISRLRASTAAVYVYVQPSISAVGGALLLGEELTPVMLVAAALVFVGIWLVSRDRFRPPSVARAPAP